VGAHEAEGQGAFARISSKQGRGPDIDAVFLESFKRVVNLPV
jgi:hypothetical protein